MKSPEHETGWLKHYAAQYWNAGYYLSRWKRTFYEEVNNIFCSCVPICRSLNAKTNLQFEMWV